MHALPCSTAPSVSDWLAASCRHVPLAERTVLELSRRIQRWQRHPDGPDQAPAPVRSRALRARDHLVCHNLRLVGHTWRRHRHSLPSHQEGTADAFQEAALNLLRAAEKYDPSRGYCFSTYASFWVRRGFSDVEKRDKRFIRFPHDKCAVVLQAERLREQYQAATGELPTLEWLAQRCRVNGARISRDELGELLNQWYQTRTGSLDGGELAAGGEGSKRLEQASLHNDNEPAAGDDTQLAALPRLLEALEPEQRQLIEGRYLQSPAMSRTELRKRLGRTPRQMRALEEQALGRLRERARELRLLPGA